MRTMKILILGLVALCSTLSAQTNSLVATTLGAAMTASQSSVTVAATTGINAPSISVPGSALYVVDVGQTLGELVLVTGPAVGLVVPVSRTRGRGSAHASGAMVLIATAPNWFYNINAVGGCTLTSTYVAPWVNVNTGEQWRCSAQTGTWVPGWGNRTASPQALSGTATASVAGATAISGPFLEISGTNAITSFTMSVGWNGNDFCVRPTAAFTTTATNNIAIASTAVAAKLLCYKWDAVTSTFAASY